MILHRNLSKIKNKYLPTCLQGKYRDSLGEFSNTSYGVFGVYFQVLRACHQQEWKARLEHMRAHPVFSDWSLVELIKANTSCKLREVPDNTVSNLPFTFYLKNINI